MAYEQPERLLIFNDAQLCTKGTIPVYKQPRVFNSIQAQIKMGKF